MTTYLKNYVGSVSDLPGELARKFKLMRELDDKAHVLQAEAEAAARQRLEELAQKVGALMYSCMRAAGRQATWPMSGTQPLLEAFPFVHQQASAGAWAPLHASLYGSHHQRPCKLPCRQSKPVRRQPRSAPGLLRPARRTMPRQARQQISRLRSRCDRSAQHPAHIASYD